MVATGRSLPQLGSRGVGDERGDRRPELVPARLPAVEHVAAAEVAVGLAIIVAIFRLRRRLSVDELSTLRG